MYFMVHVDSDRTMRVIISGDTRVWIGSGLFSVCYARPEDLFPKRLIRRRRTNNARLPTRPDIDRTTDDDDDHLKRSMRGFFVYVFFFFQFPSSIHSSRP